MSASLIRASAIMAVLYVGFISLTAFEMSRMPSGFIPEQDIGYQAAIVILPPGSSLERTDAVVREANDIILKTVPGPTHTSPVTGFDVTTTTIAPNVGTIFYGLPSLYGHHIPGINAATMLPRVRAALSGIKDAVVIVVNPPPVQGLGAAGGFKLMVEDRGDHTPQELADATNTLVAAANKDPAFGGVFTFYNAGAPSLYTDVDREKAEKIGLTPADVFSTLQVYLGSQYVNDFNYLGRTYEVLRKRTSNSVRRRRKSATSRSVTPVVRWCRLDRSPVQRPDRALPSAALQPVSRGRRIGLRGGRSCIGHRHGAYGSACQGGVACRLRRRMDGAVPSAGTAGDPTIAIFAASAFFVFLVLAAQYESWKLPLAIVLIVPMCLLASATGLAFRGIRSTSSLRSDSSCWWDWPPRTQS